MDDDDDTVDDEDLNADDLHHEMGSEVGQDNDDLCDIGNYDDFAAADDDEDHYEMGSEVGHAGDNFNGIGDDNDGNDY